MCHSSTTWASGKSKTMTLIRRSTQWRFYNNIVNKLHEPITFHGCHVVSVQATGSTSALIIYSIVIIASAADNHHHSLRLPSVSYLLSPLVTSSSGWPSPSGMVLLHHSLRLPSVSYLLSPLVTSSSGWPSPSGMLPFGLDTSLHDPWRWTAQALSEISVRQLVTPCTK